MKTHIRVLILAACAALTTIPSAQAGGSYPLKKCIVTGDAFGADLGDPIDVNYKGRLVRLCCKSCVKKFNANPQKYLAILDRELATATR